MHVLEIVSTLLVALSMIVRLPHRHHYCICKYRLRSRAFFDDSGEAAFTRPASPPPGSRSSEPRPTSCRPKTRRWPGPARARSAATRFAPGSGGGGQMPSTASEDGLAPCPTFPHRTESFPGLVQRQDGTDLRLDPGLGNQVH